MNLNLSFVVQFTLRGKLECTAEFWIARLFDFKVGFGTLLERDWAISYFCSEENGCGSNEELSAMVL